jgi:hypothetical protein
MTVRVVCQSDVDAARRKWRQVEAHLKHIEQQLQRTYDCCDVNRLVRERRMLLTQRERAFAEYQALEAELPRRASIKISPPPAVSRANGSAAKPYLSRERVVRALRNWDKSALPRAWKARCDEVPIVMARALCELSCGVRRGESMYLTRALQTRA